ncbi:MAG: DUF4342 domain-containing protein [Caldilineaceae bacterium]|nr:DUF4342 domain-containing protein [Caldilineaceae bacterium]
MNTENTNSNERTWTEEFEVAGSQLVARVKELIAQGNVRRLIIRKPSGAKLLEIPLNAGVAVGGFMMLAMPWLLALTAVAALVAEFKIEVVRAASQPDAKAEKKNISEIPIERQEGTGDSA